MSRSFFISSLLLAILFLSTGHARAIEIPFVGNLFGGAKEAPAANSDSASYDSARSVATATPPSKTPGTKEWWSKNRKRAIFVPGEGYRVNGYDGFFDEQGRAIDAPVDEITVKLTADLEEEGGLIPGVDPKLAAKRVREAMGLGPNQQAAQDLLAKGIREFGEKKYSRAASTFEKSASRWPGSSIESKALFNIGEAYFFTEKYKAAADAYTVLLDKHPSTPRLNDTIERLWAIAQYWEESYFATDSHPPLDYNLLSERGPRPIRLVMLSNCTKRFA